MNAKEEYLCNLQSYINKVDNDITMILQNLQWDRKHLLESKPLLPCSHDASHMIPLEKKESHEKECLIKRLGYHPEEWLLPDPPDSELPTLVTFTTANVNQIINHAAATDPQFKRGAGNHSGPQPLSLARLQRTFTADERRALHEAAVRAAPSQDDALALISSTEGEPGASTLPAGAPSRLSLLAQQRDLRRRRAKYRTAAKTKNYSDVLRDVIKTQMEMYAESQDNEDKEAPKETPSNNPYGNETQTNNKIQHSGERLTQRKDFRSRYNDFGRNKYNDKYVERQRREDMPYTRNERDKHSRYYDRTDNDRNKRFDENRTHIKEEYPRADKERDGYKSHKDRKRRYEREYRKDHRNREEGPGTSRRHNKDNNYDRKRRKDHRESSSRGTDCVVKKEKED